jgi:hypothetical protein
MHHYCYLVGVVIGALDLVSAKSTCEMMVPAGKDSSANLACLSYQLATKLCRMNF